VTTKLRTLIAPVAALVWLAGGAGCGGAAREAEPQAPPPKSGGRTPLTELDALEHDLAVSERRLDAQIGKQTDTRSAERAEPATEAPPPPPPPAQPGAPADEESAPAAGDSKDESSAVGAPCDMACRALGSMRRAADRICELAGADHARCAAARDRVAGAEQRIRSARCECRANAP
jgi:hypothetical protein